MQFRMTGKLWLTLPKCLDLGVGVQESTPHRETQGPQSLVSPWASGKKSILHLFSSQLILNIWSFCGPFAFHRLAFIIQKLWQKWLSHPFSGGDKTYALEQRTTKIFMTVNQQMSYHNARKTLIGWFLACLAKNPPLPSKTKPFTNESVCQWL